MLATFLGAWVAVSSRNSRNNVLRPHGTVRLDGGATYLVSDVVTRWDDVSLRRDTSDVRVFVHHLPLALNDDLLDCYAAESSGAYPWMDDIPHGDCMSTAALCGSHKAQEVGQYAADIWLHRALLLHPNLTTDIDAADVFFVPFYGMLSAMLEAPCNNQTHADRARRLADVLSGSPAFQRHGRKHALAISHWDARPIMQDAELRPLVDNSNMVLLVTDPAFLSFFYRGDEEPGNTWRGRFNGMVAEPWEQLATMHCRTVVLPYVPQTSLSELAPTEISDRKRSLLGFYQGNSNLSSCFDVDWRLRTLSGPAAYCGLRSGMVDALRQEPDFLVLDSNSNAHQTVHGYSAISYTEGVLTSTFCLIPRGDTPSSRRLFDAIVGGCIPVVISDELVVPFNRQLNYSSFALRLNEREVETDPHLIAHSLRSISPALIARMQRRLREVRDNFVFGRRMDRHGLSVPTALAARVLVEVWDAVQTQADPVQDIVQGAVQMNAAKGLHATPTCKLNTFAPVWIFSSYHKTGCEFESGLIDALASTEFVQLGMVPPGGLDENHGGGGHLLGDDQFWHKDWPAYLSDADMWRQLARQPKANWWFDPNLDEALPRLLNGAHRDGRAFRLLHMVRSPAKLIASAYRFHAVNGHEKWLFWNRTMLLSACNSSPQSALGGGPELACDILATPARLTEAGHVDAARELNASLEANLSWRQILNETANETRGALLQTYHSQRSIALMVSNVEVSASSPEVLALTVEDLEASFNSTMKCLLSALDEVSRIHIEATMSSDWIQALDVTRNVVSLDDDHITAGKYENAGVLRVASAEPFVKAATRRFDASMALVRSC